MPFLRYKKIIDLSRNKYNRFQSGFRKYKLEILYMIDIVSDKLHNKEYREKKERRGKRYNEQDYIKILEEMKEKQVR